MKSCKDPSCFFLLGSRPRYKKEKNYSLNYRKFENKGLRIDYTAKRPNVTKTEPPVKVSVKPSNITKIRYNQNIEIRLLNKNVKNGQINNTEDILRIKMIFKSRIWVQSI